MRKELPCVQHIPPSLGVGLLTRSVPPNLVPLWTLGIQTAHGMAQHGPCAAAACSVAVCGRHRRRDFPQPAARRHFSFVSGSSSLLVVVI